MIFESLIQSSVDAFSVGIRKENRTFRRGANTKFQRMLNAHCRVVEA